MPRAASTAAFVTLCALAFAAALPDGGQAQSRSPFFDEPSELRLIGSIPEEGETLPVVLFLPHTTGTAEGAFSYLAGAIPFKSFVAILPAGRPTREDYLPRFYQYVTWLQERVLLDLGRAREAYPVDDERIFLAGFSLGGDTSWALLARNPDVFRGAVVLGSRSSARARASAMSTFRERGVRVAFAIGESDTEVRIRGIRRAHRSLSEGGVPTRLDLYPGGHSIPGDPGLLRRLFDFVMWPEPDPSEDAPAGAALESAP